MRISLPVIIIIIVTGFAFFAGFIQNSYTNLAEDSRNLASDYQWVASRMEERIRIISTLDGEQALKAAEKIQEGAFLAIEFYALESGLTPDEVTKYQLDFAAAMMTANVFIRTTVAGIAHEFFENNPQLDTYEISTRERDRYDYNITRERWDIYKPMYTDPMNSYLLGLGLGGIMSDITELTDDFLGVDFEFYSLDWDNIYNLYREPLWDELDKVDEHLALASGYEAIASKITMGVAVTTVSTVLAAAMASRIENKKADKNFSLVRSDIQQDPTLIESGMDMLAYLGLLLALIIAVLGLIMPLAMP